MQCQLLYFILVAVLWGCTNPLLKRGSKGLEDVTKTTNKLLNFILQLKWLIFNYKFTIPFLVNQCGSVLYFIVVGQSDISLAVPITNSLTLAVTSVVGTLLGEEIQSFRSYCGMACIIIGVCLSVIN
jgi:uncharacterized membrane protein